MTALLIKAILSYLLGSISGSMVMGRLRDVDIRGSGSGNAGGTNAFRTQGFKFALGVVLIDIGKGALAAALFPLLNWPASTSMPIENQAMICGFMAVIGHCFPIWHGFRGGKGAATAVGALLVIQPLVVLPMVLAWLLVLVLTGWVGLATILAALTLIPSFAWVTDSQFAFWFSITLVAFIVFMHRENIVKLVRGTENRFEKIRIINWFKSD